MDDLVCGFRQVKSPKEGQGGRVPRPKGVASGGVALSKDRGGQDDEGYAAAGERLSLTTLLEVDCKSVVSLVGDGAKFVF